MLSIRTVQPGKWSLAQDDPRAAVLAGALGIAGTADASLHLRLVITREDH